MEIPLIMKIECARGELLNAINKIQQQYDYPACILDGLISSILIEIRQQEKIELVNANNNTLKNVKEQQEEIEKLRKEINND